MKRSGQDRRRSDQTLLNDPHFLISTSLGSLVVGLAFIWGDHTIQISVCGLLLSVLIGLMFHQSQSITESSSRVTQQVSALKPSLILQSDERLGSLTDRLLAALLRVQKHESKTFQRIATDRLSSIADEFESVSSGLLVYQATESWRNVYRRVLEDNRVTEYCSVAWVRSADYWQDRPGRQSLKLNQDLAQRGVGITRIVILSDGLFEEASGHWPEAMLLWMDQQQDAGIDIRWLRESELAREQDLLCDVGIYGELAVGYLETDEQSRTRSFRLSFDPVDHKRSRQIWRRLMLYAHPGLPGDGINQIAAESSDVRL